MYICDQPKHCNRYNMIYIGYDVDNTPTVIISANSRRDAEIALYSTGEKPHHIEELDLKSDSGINGVVFLLSSVKANSRDFSHRIGGVDFRIWRRGI